jgi:hypothetical protein
MLKLSRCYFYSRRDAFAGFKRFRPHKQVEAEHCAIYRLAVLFCDTGRYGDMASRFGARLGGGFVFFHLSALSLHIS